MIATLNFPPPHRTAARNDIDEVRLPLFKCRSGRDGSIASFIESVSLRYRNAGLTHLATDIFPSKSSDQVHAIMTFRMTTNGGQLETKEAIAAIDRRDCSVRPAELQG
ncbi:hypothetical protein ACXYL9_12740 [Qipengyuania sp. CAU 1752]